MFKKINVEESYFYEVNKELIKNELNWAYITSKEKFSYTINHWERGCVTKFFDIYFGDLAKNLIKILIESETGLSIVEYDEIRTDGFTKYDKFDLMIQNNEIEVKSSLEKYTKELQEIYNNRRIIIGLYKHNESIPDYRVQVFFIPKNLKDFWKFMEDDNCNCNNFENHREDILSLLPDIIMGVNIIIAGWIKKEDEEEKLLIPDNTLKIKNNSYNNQKREYINFFISETRKMDELVDELLKKKL